jgi:hypothetical protein
VWIKKKFQQTSEIIDEIKKILLAHIVNSSDPPFRVSQAGTPAAGVCLQRQSSIRDDPFYDERYKEL